MRELLLAYGWRVVLHQDFALMVNNNAIQQNLLK